MDVKQVFDSRFQKYGRIIKEVDFTGLLKELSSLPVTEEVVYEPSVKKLEQSMRKEGLRSLFGEQEVQIGYCGGKNRKLNAVEYHRNSEVDVALTDLILLLGSQQDITEEYQYDTSKMEAFFLPAGYGVELYATTLHYAPCQSSEDGFMAAIILPKGTNLPLSVEGGLGEDRLLFAKNKWLIGHPEGGLPEEAYLGLIGENITL